jgi:hypothetical protein
MWDNLRGGGVRVENVGSGGKVVLTVLATKKKFRGNSFVSKCFFVLQSERAVIPRLTSVILP